jgi:hypothetical protein
MGLDGSSASPHNRRSSGGNYLNLSLRRSGFACLVAGFAVMGAIPAQASITFSVNYGASISSDPNFATIQQSINSALAVYTSQIITNVNVALNFEGMGSGLGQSNTFIGTLSYAQVRAALVTNATSVDDSVALANLPGGPNNPVNGSTNLIVTTANLRALGFNAPPPPGSPDGTISLNTSIMNLDRNSIDPNKYDLISVVSHEVDEVLGFGSGLNDNIGVRMQDLFRYDQNGVRSFNGSSGVQSFFSIDGTTQLAQFNQNGGGDYGDWASSATARVQDAFATVGTTPNLGIELRELDVIGYNLAPSAVPEPATCAMFGFGLAGLLVARRTRRQA